MQKQPLMKRVLLFLPLFGFFLTVTAQYNCWIQFANKKGTSGSLSNPSAYLSSKAIMRRTRQHLEVDSTDLPVNSAYIHSVLQKGAVLKSASRWLNGITVILPDTSLLSVFRALPFVKKVELTLTPVGYTLQAPSKMPEMPSMINDVYGTATQQIDMHNGRKLHADGFRGKGMVVGVLDAGFYKTDQISVFDSLRLQGRLLGVKDFAAPSVSFFANTAFHGTNVLSTMAANQPDIMIGTAPDASYWLIRTEYSPSEYIVETDNWVAGLEFADSVGVDIVNSSLGYTQFDNSGMDYTYQSLNGKTSRASIAATMAARKGMIVVNSAGNEGNKLWHYISAPADADSILTVGAVDYNGSHASFSGYGSTADGRIKPDVCAVGYQAVIATSANTIATNNGTSFASPIMAGLVACVWQALPSYNNMQIINFFKQYSSMYAAPDNILGYGIPDVYAIYKNNFVSPNPSSDKNKGVAYFADGALKIDRLAKVKMPAMAILHTQTGQKLAEWPVQALPAILGTATLPSGFYLLSVVGSQSSEVYKLVKH
jgi:subtilisin family serine protease